jgi:hypothetical protein
VLEVEKMTPPGHKRGRGSKAKGQSAISADQLRGRDVSLDELSVKSDGYLVACCFEPQGQPLDMPQEKVPC